MDQMLALSSHANKGLETNSFFVRSPPVAQPFF